MRRLLQSFNVTNASTSNFNRVELRGNADYEVINEATFDCTSGAQDCIFNYNGPAITKPATLVFYDESNRIAAAFPILNEPGKTMSLITSNYLSGYLIYERLAAVFVKKTGYHYSNFIVNLTDFFANYENRDGLSDSFDEIYAYYKLQSVKNPGTFSGFLNDFATRLINHEVADASEFNPLTAWQKIKDAGLLATVSATFKSSEKNPLISSAFAQAAPASKCPAGLTQFFAVVDKTAGSGLSWVAEAFAKAYPVVGPILNSTGAIGIQLCNDTNSKIDYLTTKVAELQVSVNAVEKSVGKLSDFIAQTNQTDFSLQMDKPFGDVLVNFNKFKDVSSGPINRYNSYLTAVNGGSATEYKTIKEYVTANGGLTKVWNDSLKSILVDDPATYKKEIDGLTISDNLKKVSDSLNTVCQNPTVNDDLIGTRVKCNLYILHTIFKLQLLQNQALIMLDDVYATLATNEAFAKTKTTAFPTGASTYSDSVEKQRDVFRGQLELLATHFKNNILLPDGSKTDKTQGLYDAFATTDTTLLSLYSKLKDVQCWDDVGKVPLISTMQIGTDDITNFVTTQCRFPNSRWSVKARYYWKSDGADVVSIGGVLVPQSTVLKPGDYYKNNSSNITSSKKRYLSYPNIMENPNWDTKRWYCIGDLEVDPNSIKNSVRFPQDRSLSTDKAFDEIRCDLPWTLDYSLFYTRYYDVSATKPSSGNILSNDSILVKNSPSGSASWMSVNDSFGFHHAFKIVGGSFDQLMCATADCSVKNSYTLSFKPDDKNSTITMGDQRWKADSRSTWGGWYVWDLIIK